jgi:hypothetical protein
MITYLKDIEKESERIRQMGGRTKMLTETRVLAIYKKRWYNENNNKHLFHKIQRSRFIMSLRTGKYKFCVVCIHVWQWGRGNDSQYSGSLVAAVN